MCLPARLHRSERYHHFSKAWVINADTVPGKCCWVVLKLTTTLPYQSGRSNMLVFLRRNVKEKLTDCWPWPCHQWKWHRQNVNLFPGLRNKIALPPQWIQRRVITVIRGDVYVPPSSHVPAAHCFWRQLSKFTGVKTKNDADASRWKLKNEEHTGEWDKGKDRKWQGQRKWQGKWQRNQIRR